MYMHVLIYNLKIIKNHVQIVLKINKNLIINL